MPDDFGSDMRLRVSNLGLESQRCLSVMQPINLFYNSQNLLVKINQSGFEILSLREFSTFLQLPQLTRNSMALESIPPSV